MADIDKSSQSRVWMTTLMKESFFYDCDWISEAWRLYGKLGETVSNFQMLEVISINFPTLPHRPVGGGGDWERPGDRPVSLHCQGQDHVVGGGEGERLQELEDLAEHQPSHPLAVEDLPYQLT